MTLTAKCDGNVVYSIELGVEDQGNKYYCVECGARMSLVIPRKRIKHFRHYPGYGSGCLFGTNESEDHVNAKLFFYNKFKNNPNYERVELEKVIELEDGSKRIGDVVLYPKNHKKIPTVIEVQRSNITRFEIHRRFIDWNSCGYSMLWVVIPRGRISIWERRLMDIYYGLVYVYQDNSVHCIYDRGSIELSVFKLLRLSSTMDNNKYMISMLDNSFVRDRIKRIKKKIADDKWMSDKSVAERSRMWDKIDMEEKEAMYSSAYCNDGSNPSDKDKFITEYLSSPDFDICTYRCIGKLSVCDSIWLRHILDEAEE